MDKKNDCQAKWNAAGAILCQIARYSSDIMKTNIVLEEEIFLL